MVHSLFASFVGTIAGVFIGGGALLYVGVTGGETIDTIITLVTTSVVGSLTAAPLGVFTGVTGGILGGLVGVGFVLLPLPDWLFLHVPLGAFGTKILVAAIVGTLLPLIAPH